MLAADGSYALGDWINRYQTESWQRPKNCTARTVTGDPLVGEQALPRTTDPLGNPVDCLEAPMMGIQFGGDDPFNSPNPDANFFSSVDGNYGFGDAWTSPASDLPDGSPDPAQPRLRLRAADAGRLHRQGRDPERSDPGPPALHADARRGRQRLHAATRSSRPTRRRPASARCTPCTSRTRTSSTAAAAPSTARPRPLCDAKLVPVRDAKSIAPELRALHRRAGPGQVLGPRQRQPQRLDRPEGDALRRDRRHRQRAGRPLRLHRPPDRHGAHRPERLLHVARPLDEHVQLPASGRPLPERLPRGRQRPGAALGAQPRLPPRVRHHLGELPGLAWADAAGRHGQHGRRHAGAVARLERHQAGAVPDRGHHAAALRGVGSVRQRR